MLILGNSLEKLKELEDNSVDSVVTDPPYGLAFMGKKWDYDVPSVELWCEVFRVLKSGGHLLSFGGTRTYHRMVVAIEDAGFEIRDQLQWLYGSGFPKSMDISKAIDKAAGAKREVVGVAGKSGSKRNAMAGDFQGGEYHSTAPATPEAKQWEGFGTALKPANEPIVLARKPLSEKTVAKNVLKWGVGGLNIDGSRIASDSMPKSCTNQNIRGDAFKSDNSDRERDTVYTPSEQGRWPANILLDETAATVLDEQSDDKKGTSRFFYVAKASKRERGDGNVHPTVKPIKLMSYLVKIVTPPGGTVLDPFMGSGTTGVACTETGFDFIGIELEQEYFEIASKRIAAKKSA
jgi:DNA modification methylase